MAHLSVVTLNTWKGEGRYDARLALIARQLAALRPDVVFLQEAFAAPAAGADTAAHLARALDLACAFQPARARRRRLLGKDVDSVSGLAILVRGAAIDSVAVPLPADPADGERIAQVATLSCNGVRLVAANVHLTHLVGRDDLRLAQLKVLHRRLAPHAAGALALAAGDFNSEPDSAPIRWFVAPDGGGATDACTLTPVPSAFPTCGDGPDGRPAMRRIDYMFLLRDAPASGVAVRSVMPACAGPDAAGVHASDHIGVHVVLETS